MIHLPGILLSGALFAAALTMAGCASPAPGPRDTLDSATGVSLRVVDRPIVLARERRDVAAQARDYLTLVAAEINEAGHRRLVWAAHQWSTIDARAAGITPAVAAELMLVADGRDLRFTAAGPALTAAYGSHPALQAPEDAEVVTTLYETDAETLQYVATSRSLTASFPESFALPFALWRDGRPSLQGLLAKTGPRK